MMIVNEFGIGKCVVVEHVHRMLKAWFWCRLVVGSFCSLWVILGSSCKSIGTKNAVYVRMKNDEATEHSFNSVWFDWLQMVARNASKRHSSTVVLDIDEMSGKSVCCGLEKNIAGIFVTRNQKLSRSVRKVRQNF